MKTINPYLNFHGNTEEAFNFYKSVFGGEFLTIMRFKDTPEAPKIPAHERDKIMHIALPIGKDTILMATDALESMGQKLAIGNNFHMSIDTESKAEADRLFKALSSEGTITVPIENMFWGSYFGMVTDKFGVQWMVSYDAPKQ
jgi:PhnB protein